MLTIPLLLLQNDVSQAVTPIFEEGDGLNNPKFIPLTVTGKTPLKRSAASTDDTLNNSEKENTPKRVPRLSNTDAATDKPMPTPLAVRHVTSVSLRHRLVAHVDAPIRTRPLQSDSPLLAPKTVTLICAVEGRMDGDTLETKREYNISGDCTASCVCKGIPAASRVDKVMLGDAVVAQRKKRFRFSKRFARAQSALHLK